MRDERGGNGEQKSRKDEREARGKREKAKGRMFFAAIGGKEKGGGEKEYKLIMKKGGETEDEAPAQACRPVNRKLLSKFM